MAKQKNPYTAVDVQYIYPGQNFHQVYHDAIESPAYMALSDGAKVLLQICKDTRRWYIADRHRGDFPNAIKGDPLLFYMNDAVQKTYGWTSGNKFRRCMRELVLYGFVEVVEDGRTSRTKNIYRYSKKWMSLKKGETVDLDNYGPNKNATLAFLKEHKRKSAVSD